MSIFSLTLNWHVKVSQDWLTDWTRTMSYERNAVFFFFLMETVAMLSCFSLAKIRRQCPQLSVRLAGSQFSSPLNNTATRLWERKSERERSETWNQVSSFALKSRSFQRAVFNHLCCSSCCCSLHPDASLMQQRVYWMSHLPEWMSFSHTSFFSSCRLMQNKLARIFLAC